MHKCIYIINSIAEVDFVLKKKKQNAFYLIAAAAVVIFKMIADSSRIKVPCGGGHSQLTLPPCPLISCLLTQHLLVSQHPIYP